MTDTWDKVLLALICLPSIYTSIKAIAAIEPLNPFLLIGFLGLILMTLTKYMTEITIVFLYIPTAFSLTLFLLNDPQPMVGLATGYIISLTIVMMLTAFKETPPHTYLILYLISMMLNMRFLASAEKPITSDTFIRSILHGLGDFHGSVSVDPIFSILMAPSIAALLYHILRPSKPYTSTIFSDRKSLLALPLSAIPILGLTILSKISPTLAWISSLILALITTISLTIYLRVIEH
mgnify:CR=1 FL=1